MLEIKIVTIVGARPQFIKASTVSRAVVEYNRNNAGCRVTDVIVHTGQHYDKNMSDVFFTEMNIPAPDYNLGVGGGTHGQNTGRMLEAIEQVLMDEKPDWVLVYGDTDSTLAGVLAAVKLHIPVAHVEAGLRSYNRKMPEEINRILSDHASTLLFAPTETGVRNLATEGIVGKPVCLVGDVMYDAALYYSEKAEGQSQILTNLGLETQGYLLATFHRAENTDDPKRLSGIVEGLAKAALSLPVVVPLHPRTKHALDRLGLLEKARESFQLIDPVGYLDMVMLEKHSRLICTDSGGVQKEAFFYSVPCVTLRDETEWVELVELGWNRLVDVAKDDISAVVDDRIGKKGSDSSPYGHGRAAVEIVKKLTSSGCDL
jgi:UDP-GlcNAc3NAcA epimerase